MCGKEGLVLNTMQFTGNNNSDTAEALEAEGNGQRDMVCSKLHTSVLNV